MKKFFSILCCIVFCSVAWANDDIANLKQKIQKLELIEEQTFEWIQQPEYDSDEWKELRELARTMYINNPKSFNAAYNYGVITYDTWVDEIGNPAIPELLNEAFEVFEYARKEILPNKIMLFEREYDVLHLSLFGFEIVELAPKTYHDIVTVYKDNPTLANQMLFVIKRLFSLKGFSSLEEVAPNGSDGKHLNYRDMALQAVLIQIAQNNYTGAQQWLKASGNKTSFIKLLNKEKALYEKTSNSVIENEVIKNISSRIEGSN